MVYNNTTRAQFSYIPVNYFSFIEAEGQVNFSCNNSALAYTTSTANTFIAVIPFSVANFTTPPNPFLQTKVYKVTNTVPEEIFDFSDYAPNGLSDLEEIFTVKNKILTEINKRSDMKVYWESFNGLFYPNSFIFVSDNTTVGANSVRIAYTNVLETTTPFTTISGTKVDTSTAPFDEKQSYCRLISNEEAYHLLAHPFGTTSPDSPIITIFGDKVSIFINERFILKSLTFKYIRKPRRLNLPLNQSYEIQDLRALEKIIDMTVEYLAATIESQGYQALTLENQQRD